MLQGRTYGQIYGCWKHSGATPTYFRQPFLVLAVLLIPAQEVYGGFAVPNVAPHLRAPASLLQQLEVLVGFLGACACHVHIDEVLGSLPFSASGFGVVVQQDLPLGHTADIRCGAIAARDQGAVDVAPAQRLARILSLCRWPAALRTKKGPFTPHQISMMW